MLSLKHTYVCIKIIIIIFFNATWPYCVVNQIFRVPSLTAHISFDWKLIGHHITDERWNVLFVENEIYFQFCLLKTERTIWGILAVKIHVGGDGLHCAYHPKHCIMMFIVSVQ